MKISIIMPSNLSPYEGCAADRVNKFCRAVESFLFQSHDDKELIIVADGCKITQKVYKEKFAQHHNIHLIKIPKQELFCGMVRQAGIEMATGEYICYLDTDDILETDHLKAINNNDIQNFDWVYFDDYLKYTHLPHIKPDKRICIIEKGSIGTSNIAHKNDPQRFNWMGCDGYGHDFLFIENKLLVNNCTHTKIRGPEYLVCHVPGSIDV